MFECLVISNEHMQIGGKSQREMYMIWNIQLKIVQGSPCTISFLSVKWIVSTEYMQKWGKSQVEWVMNLILQQKISRGFQDRIFFLNVSWVVSKDHMQKSCKTQVELVMKIKIARIKYIQKFGQSQIELIMIWDMKLKIVCGSQGSESGYYPFSQGTFGKIKKCMFVKM